MKGVHISAPIDTCVICGCVIPKGRQICPNCGNEWRKRVEQETKRKGKIPYKLRKNTRN